MTANQPTTHTVTVRMALDEAQVQALDAAVTALTALVDTMRPGADEDAPARPATAESDEPVTEEPAIGVQLTDSVVWQRFEGGWHWWMGEGWSHQSHTWDAMHDFDLGKLRGTTDDDRRRVGLPVRDEDASPEPVEPDTQPDEVPEGPETENGPENGAGRIGWLRDRKSVV